MSSLDMSVTLIVKAPNQQIEDQTIECELSWTIQRLKGYLSEVYPSKPRTEEQKLIYSGHLLHDACTLREVLRTYEGQQHQHTVHLVCARNTSSPSPKPKSADVAGPAPTDGVRRRTAATSSGGSSSSSGSSSSPSSTSISASSVHSSVSSSRSNSQTPPATVSSSTPTPPPTADLRQAWAAYYPGVQFPPYPHPQFPQAPLPPYPAPAVPQMAQWTQAQYAAWMQQAYAQYMAQYMHLMMSQAAGNSIQWPLAATVTDTSQGNNDPQAAVQGQGANGDRPADAPDDDENAGRDWLDWFYIMSRIAVLFSVVYFYSSPMRFIVVFALGLLMYLYQIGFFRPLDDLVADNNNDPARADAAAANNNNNVNNDNNNNQPAAQVPQAQPAAAAAADAVAAGPVGGAADGNQEADPNPAGDGAPAAEAPAVPANPAGAPDRPSPLALAWTFFTTFFASLIPEQPNVI